MNLFPIAAITLYLVASHTLHASTSEEIYQQRCASCHLKEGTVNVFHKKALLEKMQTAGKEEREKILAEMNNDMSSDYVAPPFSKVTKRLTSEFDTREEFVDFVKSYVPAPARDKGHCRPFIYERFGVMPAITDMSEKELDKIANWLYTNFKLHRAD